MAYGVRYISSSELIREAMKDESFKHAYRQLRKGPPIQRYFEKKNRKQEKSTKELWTEQAQHKESLLVFLIMIYLFNTDDGKIDKKEHKLVEKLIQKEGSILTKEERSIVLDYTKQNINIETVITYINNDKTKDETFKKALTKVQKYLKKTKKYDQVYWELVNAYKYNK